ncbi:MAG TPA: cupin domain-containing protein [Acidimicrobiia bacterium]|nr:cupin domain-containing protein [Acidimicrobiia bacterium]
MSYPEPRYLDEVGEISAVLHPATNPPDLITGPGSDAHYLATAATTGGDFGLYRWNMGVSPSGPGPHYHRTMSESFFVVSGLVRLYDGVDWVESGPGDFLYVPPGGVHGFRNESGEPASMLILFTPGAPREAYFEGLVEFASRSAPPSEDEKAEFYLLHDNIWV